jgi:hypothetical protein
MPARGTRVNVQALQPGIRLHFQNMRVARNKESRFFLLQPCFYPRRIPARVSANMLYAHFQPIAGKSKPFGEPAMQLPIINIAIHAPEWFKTLKLVGEFSGAKIAGMPYFVNVFEVFEYLRIEVAVGVGEEADAGHGGMNFNF